MKSLLKTYILDAPWRSVLLFGLFFGGCQAFILSYVNGKFLTGDWYFDLALWSLVGMTIGYQGWRSDGYLERKNKRWKENRKRSTIK